MHRAHFEVEGATFDGAKKATVLIEQDGPHALVRVRPYRRHREFVLPLGDVAQIVIERVVKAEARLGSGASRP